MNDVMNDLAQLIDNLGLGIIKEVKQIDDWAQGQRFYIEVRKGVLKMRKGYTVYISNGEIVSIRDDLKGQIVYAKE